MHGQYDASYGAFSTLAGTKLYYLMAEVHVWTTCPELLCKVKQPGVELATSWLLVQHPNHYSTTTTRGKGKKWQTKNMHILFPTYRIVHSVRSLSLPSCFHVCNFTLSHAGFEIGFCIHKHAITPKRTHDTYCHTIPHTTLTDKMWSDSSHIKWQSKMHNNP